MRKTEAFNELDYRNAAGRPFEATRGIWSAERDDGVLLTLWQREIGWLPGPNGGTLYCDVDELHPAGTQSRAELIARPKLKKQAKHLDKLVRDSSCRLDVVVLLGPVGNDKGDAYAWQTSENAGKIWKLTRLDPETGFFRVETRNLN